MKIISFLIFGLLAFTGSLFSQQADSLQKVKKQQEFLAVYHYAIQYDDMGTAAYALSNYLIQGGMATYKDTLAIVYYRNNNLNGAYILAKEVQAADAKSATALSLLADISGRAGDTKTSLNWYEKLVVVAPTPFNFYQMATRQFLLERIKECRESLEKIVSDSVQARKQQVSLELAPGKTESATAIAAAYNMLGALAHRENKTEEARRYYALAIAEMPNFDIAKQNLESLKPQKPAGKPTPSKAKN